MRELCQVPPPRPHAAQRLTGTPTFVPTIQNLLIWHDMGANDVAQDGTVWLWDLHAPTVAGNHIQFPAKDSVRQAFFAPPLNQS